VSPRPSSSTRQPTAFEIDGTRRSPRAATVMDKPDWTNAAICALIDLDGGGDAAAGIRGMLHPQSRQRRWSTVASPPTTTGHARRAEDLQSGWRADTGASRSGENRSDATLPLDNTRKVE
jgi:hypothetical protein